jgi:hypothetical protein
VECCKLDNKYESKSKYSRNTTTHLSARKIKEMAKSGTTSGENVTLTDFCKSRENVVGAAITLRAGQPSNRN